MLFIEIYSRITLRGRRTYFRIKARNGKIIAQSEGYANRADCLQTVHLIQAGARSATIVDISR